MRDRLRRSTLVRLISAYGSSKASNYAAGLALNAFLTMFPLILGLLSLIGLVVRDPATQNRLESDVASVFPGDAHAQILQALGAVRHSAGILGGAAAASSPRWSSPWPRSSAQCNAA